MNGNVGGWICGRCGNQNVPTATICQNPYCNGEPVSRTVEAVAPASTDRAA